MNKRKYKRGSAGRKSYQKSYVSTGTLVFYIVLLLAVLAFCVGMLFAMNALNDWLVRFEASQPTVKCQEVFDQLFRSPNWKNIYELSDAAQAGDITAEEYAAYMVQKHGSAQLSYIETSAGLSGDKKYIVRNGTQKVATFTLHNAQPDRDIPDWQLGQIDIFYSAELDATVIAPPEYTVQVNGQTLDESYVVRSVSTRAESYLPERGHGCRSNVMYIDGLYVEPQVQVTDPNGKPTKVLYDKESRTYRVEVTPEKINDMERRTLIQAAETYCKYMIGASGKSQLQKCFDSGSRIYKTITTNTTWMQNYSGYELGAAQITDYYRYSDNLYSAQVSMTLEVTRKDGSAKIYQLNSCFFVNDGLVTEMINSNAQDTFTQVLLTYIAEGEVIHSEMVEADSNSVKLPQVTAPEGKTFTGWFRETSGSNGLKVMELVFEPSEDGSVHIGQDTVLEPMTLYALFA